MARDFASQSDFMSFEQIVASESPKPRHKFGPGYDEIKCLITSTPRSAVERCWDWRSTSLDVTRRDLVGLWSILVACRARARMVCRFLSTCSSCSACRGEGVRTHGHLMGMITGTCQKVYMFDSPRLSVLPESTAT